MKSILLFLAAGLILNTSYSQVAINEDDSNGDASAALDIKSSNKGVLFPVMTDVERLALKSPATGLLIFNRTGGYFNVFNGTNWLQISRTIVVAASNPGGSESDIGVGVGVADPDNSALLHVNSTTKGFLLPRMSSTLPSSPATGLIFYSTSGYIINIYNGTAWVQASTTTLGAAAGGAETSAGVLIGTGVIAPSAKMEISTSSQKGLLLPRLTDAQRDAVKSPAEGLTIYNTNDNSVQYYAAATWFKWTTAANDYGMVVGNPGTSCKNIYDNNPMSIGVDGTYYINPSGVTYQCTCDMTTDGGGWTLVMNTGPRLTANNLTTASGVMPISIAAAGAFAKLSDADITLLRGTIATSIFKVNRQNSTVASKIMYLKANVAFNSTAITGANIRTYYTSYANAVALIGAVTAGAGYPGAFDTWNAPAADPYRIISNYAAEGFITNGNTFPSNRSEQSVLIWVKQP